MIWVGSLAFSRVGLECVSIYAEGFTRDQREGITPWPLGKKSPRGYIIRQTSTDLSWSEPSPTDPNKLKRKSEKYFQNSYHMHAHHGESFILVTSLSPQDHLRRATVIPPVQKGKLVPREAKKDGHFL